MEKPQSHSVASEQQAPGRELFPDDYLFDYGYGLKIRKADLAVIPVATVLLSDAKAGG